MASLKQVYLLQPCRAVACCRRKQMIYAKKTAGDKPPPYNKRSTDNLFVLLFTRLALQGIVCYTVQAYCRAVMSLPCVKGGGSRKRVGGIVKNKILSKNNPSVTFSDSSLYTREPLVCEPQKSVYFS